MRQKNFQRISQSSICFICSIHFLSMNVLFLKFAYRVVFTYNTLSNFLSMSNFSHFITIYVEFNLHKDTLCEQLLFKIKIKIVEFFLTYVYTSLKVILENYRTSSLSSPATLMNIYIMVKWTRVSMAK